MTTKEILDKCIKSCEFLVLPTTGLLAIWDIDISVYCAAGFGALASVLAFVKLFVKE